VANESVQGSAALKAALKELGDLSKPEWKSVLRAAVRNPMNAVKRRAQSNITSFSPGKTPVHKTYLGNWRSAGFAARSIAMKVTLNQRTGTATAILGVVKEAFYALSFFELGVPSRGIPRQPWLTPALEASKDDAVRQVGDAMRKRIDSIAKKRYRESIGG
jgi:hypothetical protein